MDLYDERLLFTILWCGWERSSRGMCCMISKEAQEGRIRPLFWTHWFIRFSFLVIFYNRYQNYHEVLIKREVILLYNITLKISYIIEISYLYLLTLIFLLLKLNKQHVLLSMIPVCSLVVVHTRVNNKNLLLPMYSFSVRECKRDGNVCSCRIIFF